MTFLFDNGEPFEPAFDSDYTKLKAMFDVANVPHETEGNVITINGLALAFEQYGTLDYSYAATKPESVQVGIIISGGCLDSVRASVPADIHFFDEDNYKEEEDGERAKMAEVRTQIHALPHEAY